MSAPASPIQSTSRLHGRVLFALALCLGLIVGTRGITREGAFFLPGDPPRYLMNAAFIHDFLASGTPWRVDQAMAYAERYYARYPALSLGHHPPGTPLILLPFYALFGVSIFAGRLAMLGCFAVAIVLLYRLAARLYDVRVAGWACVLFVASPIIGSFTQRVLSEMPTLTLMMVTLTVIARFRDAGRLRDYLLVIIAAVASLLNRPTAVYMFPAYAAFLLLDRGWTRLTRGWAAATTLLGLLLLLITVAAFLVMSPFNSSVALDVLSRGVQLDAVRAIWASVIRERPLFLAALAGCIVSMVRGDRRIGIALIGAISVLGSALLLTGTIETGRYTILAVPAYCLAAASLVAERHATQSTWRLPVLAGTVLLTLAAGWQVWASLSRPTWDAPGYEQAAEYVLAQTPAPTVLYSASIDPGYFVFFVRKHDPAQRLVVLRSDKLLTTSLMAQLSVEDRIDSPDEIAPLLQEYGTRFIVLEDRPSGSPPLDWLRDIVRTDRFVERRRFEIEDGFSDLRGVSLVVYEYLDATAPAPDATLDLHLPLVGREIRLPLSALTAATPKN